VGARIASRDSGRKITGGTVGAKIAGTVGAKIAGRDSGSED
jgi:hypothetical protein